MWPFKRQPKDGKPIPPEVKQYYASEHRERVGLAWLIAFVSLVVTIAVVAGLFFGGRWAYRKIAGKDSQPVITQNEPRQQSTPSQSLDTNNDSTNDRPQTTPPSNNTPRPTPKPTPAPSPSPSVSPPADSIADTGPGDTLAVFLLISALAGSAHWQYQRRRPRELI